MANVVCTECGAEAYSKCPNCRTVFPKNGMDAVLSHLLKFDHKDAAIKGFRKSTIMYYCCTDSNKSFRESTIESLNSLRETLNAMEDPETPYPSIEQYSCTHVWVLKKGEESEIGCGCVSPIK